MAEPSYMDSLVGWLRGNPAPAKVTETPAPPLANYPTDVDADYAKKYGFGYGTGNEPFLSDNKANVLGTSIAVAPKKGQAPKPQDVFIPENSGDALARITGSGDVVNDLLQLSADPRHSKVADVSQAPGMENYMMKAGLAANRSPIAGLGFDPNRATVDALSQGKKYTVAGAYDPASDQMYTNLTQANPSSLVHESTHRGLEKLRQQYPEQVAALWKSQEMPDEETVVRWLMHKNAGDPEGTDGPADKQQRAQAVGSFDGAMPALKGQRNAGIAQLEELAAQAIKNKRPGGPH